jgi:hypothetical protein
LNARAVIAALVLASGSARAADRATCVAAHEAGQIERRDGKLNKARASFATCAEAECPPSVQRQCVDFLMALDAEQPTLNIAPKDERGGDVLDATVTLDDRAVVMDGKPTPVDVGTHVVTVSANGRATATVRLVARLGEKNRAVSVILAPVAPEPPRPPRPEARPVPIVSWVLGGVSIVALGSFVGFGLAGKSQEQHLDACKAHCDPADPAFAARRRDYVIADVSLGVSIVALGLAAYFYLTRPSVRASPGPIGAVF